MLVWLGCALVLTVGSFVGVVVRIDGGLVSIAVIGLMLLLLVVARVVLCWLSRSALVRNAVVIAV